MSEKSNRRKELDNYISMISDSDVLGELVLAGDDITARLSALEEFCRRTSTDYEFHEFEEELHDLFFSFTDQAFEATKILKKSSKDKLVLMLLGFVLELMEENNIVSPETMKVPKEPPVWPWPVINVPESKVSDPGYAEDWHEMSPLKIFGYTVGKTKGWPSAKRLQFLDDFMTYVLPKIVIDTYGDYYGDPMSVDRLKATAQLLASLIKSAKRRRDNSMRYAIADWEHDLNYLRKEYYEGKGLKFNPWPSSNPIA